MKHGSQPACAPSARLAASHNVLARYLRPMVSLLSPMLTAWAMRALITPLTRPLMRGLAQRLLGPDAGRPG